MKAKVQVIGVESHKYEKTGTMYHRLNCLELDVGAHRFKNTFEYNMSKVDLDQYPDPAKLAETTLELALNDVRTGRGGRFEFSGQILTAPKSTK